MFYILQNHTILIKKCILSPFKRNVMLFYVFRVLIFIPFECHIHIKYTYYFMYLSRRILQHFAIFNFIIDRHGLVFI